MRVSKNFTIMLLFYIISFENVLSQNIFQKSYFTGASGYTSGNSFVKLPNSNYLCFGINYIPPSFGNLYLLKIDSIGIILWSKLILMTNGITEYPFHICKTDDGNFILTTTSALIKVDSNGNNIWSKRFSDTTTYISIQLNKTMAFNNNYYSIGHTMINSPNPDTTYQGILAKSDSNGNLQWIKGYGNHSTEINDFALSPDSGFILIATVQNYDSIGNGDCKLYYFKVDSLGSPQWAYQWDVPYCAKISAIIDDGAGFLLGGTYNPFGIDGDAFIFKIDYSGTVMWSKKYGSMATGNDHVNTLVELKNGSFAAGGMSHYYFSIDSFGNNPIIHAFSNFGYGQFHNMIAEDDGGLCGIGVTNSNGGYLYLFKADSNLYTCINYSGPYASSNITFTQDTLLLAQSSVFLFLSTISLTDSIVSTSDSIYCQTATSANVNSSYRNVVNVYPNPFNDEIIVEIENYINESATISLFDLAGRKISSFSTVDNMHFNINTNLISNGIYLLKINYLNHQFIKPMIKF